MKCAAELQIYHSMFCVRTGLFSFNSFSDLLMISQFQFQVDILGLCI